jgi:hypothetical protein
VNQPSGSILIFWKRLRDAIFALPSHFDSQTKIDGMLAPDVFTLASALGATIEEEVVQTLNRMRSVWDPDKRYETYGFIRQPQTFPDVLLRRKGDGHDVLLGIELKGWYLLNSGGNFGRLARYGVMNEYVQRMMAMSVRGVSADEWLRFFKKHARGETTPPTA